MIVFEEDDYIEHYGTPRRSGRYPWGSGGNSQHSKDFLAYVTDLRRQGLSEVEIAKGLGITTTELRAQKSLAKNEAKAADIAMAQRLKDKAWSNVAIGERMGIPESSVRVLLKPGTKDKNDILVTTANMLKEQVDEKKYIDVSAGVEHHIGVSRNKLNNAVAMLKEQGYTIHYVKVDQLGTGLQTSIKVLAPPNTPYAEVFRNRDNIQQSFVYSPDGGRSFNKPQPPLSISSKRIAIKYAEEGGTEADGVVYVRPGVKDCSLGGARYSQVRIAVDGTHYIKGMAVYKDDLPDGVDLMFNTNKSNTGNKLDALKKMSDDPENPFGSSISRQILEHTKDGKTIRVTSSHHQAQLPFNLHQEEYTILGWTENLLAFHRDGNNDEVNPEVECEDVMYHKANNLGIQSHPEWCFPPSSPSEIVMIDYYQTLLDKFLNKEL